MVDANWMVQMARELPVVGAVIFIVITFLKHMRSRDEEHQQEMAKLVKETHDRYKENTGTCDQRNARVCMAIDKNTGMLDELNRQLYKLNGSKNADGNVPA